MQHKAAFHQDLHCHENPTKSIVFIHIFYANLMSNYEGQSSMLQLYNANVVWFLINWNGAPVLLACIKFSQFIWFKCFFPKFNRPLNPGFIIPVIKSICDRPYWWKGILRLGSSNPRLQATLWSKAHHFLFKPGHKNLGYWWNFQQVTVSLCPGKNACSLPKNLDLICIRPKWNICVVPDAYQQNLG